MAGIRDDAAPVPKALCSLANTLDWLEQRMPPLIEKLPPARRLAFLEVSLFCLLEHLEFRDVMATAPYPALRAFAAAFGERPAARSTPFRMDTP